MHHRRTHGPATAQGREQPGPHHPTPSRTNADSILLITAVPRITGARGGFSRAATGGRPWRLALTDARRCSGPPARDTRAITNARVIAGVREIADNRADRAPATSSSAGRPALEIPGRHLAECGRAVRRLMAGDGGPSLMAGGR